MQTTRQAIFMAAVAAGAAGIKEISLQHCVVITAGYWEPWLLWMVAA